MPDCGRWLPAWLPDRAAGFAGARLVADYREMRDRRSLVDILQMHEDVNFEPVVSRARPRAAEL